MNIFTLYVELFRTNISNDLEISRMKKKKLERRARNFGTTVPTCNPMAFSSRRNTRVIGAPRNSGSRAFFVSDPGFERERFLVSLMRAAAASRGRVYTTEWRLGVATEL